MEASEMLQQAGYDDKGQVAYVAFKVGDVVQLKSGGPQMTVTALNQFYITAAYFDGNDRLTDSQFPPEALQPVKPEDTDYVDMAHG